MFAPIFACLFGCGQQVSVTVEATAGAKARAETHFTMAASDPNVRPANPDYVAISRAVARALASQGFEEAKTPEAADLLVLIDWMVSDPKVVARHAGGDVGEPAVRGVAAGTPGHPVGGTNNAASFGFGVEGQDRGEILYNRTLILKGVDRAAYKADPTAKPAWSMTLTSEGGTDDVTQFAPQMVAAALPYVASNAGKVHARLGSTEDPVRYVRGDIPALPVRKP
ncbi:MAG: hypothetical protein ACXU82_03060 [Caulobacteraceae bacterium]